MKIGKTTWQERQEKEGPITVQMVWVKVLEQPLPIVLTRETVVLRAGDTLDLAITFDDLTDGTETQKEKERQ